MGIANMVVTQEAEKGFYPTPPQVVKKLLTGLNLNDYNSILEPSAGTGNIVSGLLEKWYILRKWCSAKIEIDCIELDPNLRTILKYEFCGGKLQELIELNRKYNHRNIYKLSDEESEQYKMLDMRIETLKSGNVHIIHDDFLRYNSPKTYDLIVMNPPFSNGDEHLLKALQIQQRSGGEIRCILNAETIKNPFSNKRRLLMQKLNELGAEISFHEDMFSDGERPTKVEVAIIKVSVPRQKQESKIFERLKKAANIDEPPSDVEDLSVSDFFTQIVSFYDVEVAAGIELITEYYALRSHITSSGMGLMIDDKPASINSYLRQVRLKYWEALFSNKDFIGKLTSNLREEYMDKINALADYDFTMFNIQQIATEMNAAMGKGIEDTIIALFDKLTTEYSWYPEMQKNVHYYNGWATNKAHRINKKVILPIYGVFSSYSWAKTFEVYEAERTISDIEKVFEYLDGNMTAAVDLHDVLLRACEAGQTKNIPCKFFNVTLYKKGTMHITFRNQELLDRFNIYCCNKKNWLPPNYGRTAYKDMSQTEKAVVDGFNGNGEKGSGEKSYAEVLAKKAYYLAEPTNGALMLAASNG